ncbi:hypothetical protein [Cyanobium sp. LEGE 06113]|uniref:hypothetical protein n=1 Tax=Cyanobium sp. LEGE 06113 TaxID=1297573 RepID=UPI00187F2D61|nr:hypothetical protein [Cyanobium sp. LEGE 06113]MBE9154751.1 hypothetical protein [Cyanobium sp. LEGE 06113]
MTIPSICLSRRLVRTGLATAAGLSLALGSLGPALAQTSAPPERLTPAQREKIFPERKALTLKLQKERSQIQQKSERCVSGASNQQELRSCRKDERKANQKLRAQYRDEMRKIYERNGIEAPVGGPGKGRRGGKRQATPGS